MKQKVFNLMVLDESGSMGFIKDAAISGVNETIQTIRSAQRDMEDQEHYVSLMTFNSSKMNMVYDCQPIAEVRELKRSQFVPNECTPLYDAMGRSFNALLKKVTKEDRVLVTIITDGYENSSVEYTKESIGALVNALKAQGWIFVYIGANQDANVVGTSICINNTLNFEFSSEGTKEMMNEVNCRRRELYDRISSCDFSPEEENRGFFNRKK